MRWIIDFTTMRSLTPFVFCFIADSWSGKWHVKQTEHNLMLKTPSVLSVTLKYPYALQFSGQRSHNGTVTFIIPTGWPWEKQRKGRYNSRPNDADNWQPLISHFVFLSSSNNVASISSPFSEILFAFTARAQGAQCVLFNFPGSPQLDCFWHLAPSSSPVPWHFVFLFSSNNVSSISSPFSEILFAFTARAQSLQCVLVEFPGSPQFSGFWHLAPSSSPVPWHIPAVAVDSRIEIEAFVLISKLASSSSEFWCALCW